LIPDYDSYVAGVYGVVDYRPNENWLFEAGARFDYTYMDVFKFYRSSLWESRGYNERLAKIVVENRGNQILVNPEPEFNNVSATLGSTYSFGDDYQLFLNYSLAARAPNPSELYSEGLHHSASRIELGDLEFSSEIGHKFSLTLNKQAESFSFSVNPFIHNIDDFIVIEPTEVQQTIRGNFQVWEYRQTNTQLLGVDVDASYVFAKNFRFDHQFSLVKGYERSLDEALINMPPVNTTNGIVYQNPDAHNLRLHLQSQYVFRQNEFPDTNFDVFIAATESFETVDVSTPPDAYHLLNFDSSIDFEIGQGSALRLGFGVTNLLNTAYRDYLNRLRYYADNLERNFTVNLKLNY